MTPVTDPENPTTWEDIQKQVTLLRKAVDNIDPPPEPDDSFGEAVYKVRAGCESLEYVTEARIRRQMGEE
jgi:hypothetical protein